MFFFIECPAWELRALLAQGNCNMCAFEINYLELDFFLFYITINALYCSGEGGYYTCFPKCRLS